VTRDPYELLGVPRDADAATLAAARRRRAFDVHPDRGGSGEAMQELNEAYRQALRNLVPPMVVAPQPAEHAADPSAPRQPRRRQRSSGYQRVVRDEASFTIDALPAEAFEALLVVTTWMGELLADDPPYVLEAFLLEPEPCWCRLDLVPDAGSSTVSITLAGIEGPAPDVDEVRDLWVANLNRLGD
jgi:hypothetical protein